MGRASRAAALGLAALLVAATPAFADDQTIEIDPFAPLKPGDVISLKNPSLAAVLSGGLPLALAGASLLVKPGALGTGLVIGAPVLSGLGDLYAGSPWRALTVGLMGPVCVAAGWGLGTLYGQSQGADAASRATFANNGLMWGFGLYTAWAALDAYVTADLQNKIMLRRAGINDGQ